MTDPASQRPLERLMRRVQHMVGVGRTTTPPDDTGAAQTVQLQTHSGVHVDKVPVAALFGLSSVMPVGSDVCFLSVSGDSSAKVAVTTGHQASRPRNTPIGGTVLHDQTTQGENGTQLVMPNDGTATLSMAEKFTISIPGMTTVFTGAGVTITIGGTSYAFTAASLAAMGGLITSNENIIAGLGTGDQVTLQHHTHPTAAPGGPSMPTPGT